MLVVVLQLLIVARLSRLTVAVFVGDAGGSGNEGVEGVLFSCFFGVVPVSANLKKFYLVLLDVFVPCCDNRKMLPGVSDCIYTPKPLSCVL